LAAGDDVMSVSLLEDVLVPFAPAITEVIVLPSLIIVEVKEYPASLLVVTG
jgi:hypothetical protein